MSELLPNIHDAELVGIEITDERKTVRLSLIDNEKVGVALIASGVTAFRLVDMGMQNVVYRLLRLQGETITPSIDLGERLGWVTSCLDAPSYLSDAAMNDYLGRIKSGSLCLLLLEPSAGAELAILCESVTIKHQGS